MKKINKILLLLLLLVTMITPVYAAASNNKYLKELEVEKHKIYFGKERTNYSIVLEEGENSVKVKAVAEDGTIIGSVRAYEDAATVYIGKLMVHPDYRRQGYGRILLTEIENCYNEKRFELFSSTRSKDNIRLYQKAGYTIFDQKPINEDIVFVYLEKK